MRVLQLGKYYFPEVGGIESHLQLLCGELRGHVDVDVLVCNSRPTREDGLVEGIRVTRSLELVKLASTSLCPLMPIELSERRYDVLHVHFPNPMGVMSYLCSLRTHRHSVVVTYHSDIVKQARLLTVYRPFMDAVLRRADAILCTSPNYLEGSDALGPHRAKCHVVPYGIDIAQFDRSDSVLREAAALRARFRNRRLIMSVGRLVYYKGFEYAIRAMKSLDADLVIIGDGPLRPALEHAAREAGVAGRVHLVGEVANSQLAPWYHACDVFALPSIARSEAFALVQIEAMACGKPVVNTAIVGSGVPFVSRDGESGLTVEPRDPEGLAKALHRILENGELASRFGEAGRARVHREFSKERMAKRTLDIYRGVAPRGDRHGFAAPPSAPTLPRGEMGGPAWPG